MDETKVSAALPGPDVVIVRCDSPEANAEVVTIRMQATPSFAAVADALTRPDLPAIGLLWMNPVLGWARLTEATWAQWWGTMLPGPDRCPGVRPGAPQPGTDRD